MMRIALPVLTALWLVSGWSELAFSGSGNGVGGSPGFASSSPTIAVDSSGNPTVAWAEELGGGNTEIYVRHFDGSSWVELTGSATGGGVSATPGPSTSPVIALKPSGNPVVAWVEGGLISVKRYTGAAWVPLGAPFGGPAAQRPSIALNSLGDPIVAWADLVAGGNIYVRQWDGAAWNPLPGSDANAGIPTAAPSTEPSIALTAADVVTVAWTEDLGGGNAEIYAATNDGANWVGLGGSLTGGGISATAGASASPSVALNSSSNPVVAWSEDLGGGNHDIYLKQFDGIAWVEIASSASAGGISSSAGDSTVPSLVTIESSATPVVAWDENVSGNTEVYARRLTGGSWVETLGSSTGGGVSSTAGASFAPSLARDAANTLSVAWAEDVSGTTEVYARRTMGSSGGSGSTGGVTVTSAKQQPSCGLLGAETVLLLLLLARRSTSRS